MQQLRLGELWLYGSYTASQAPSSCRVVWNAEAIDTLNTFGATSSTSTVPAGVGSARVWARVRHDGQGGSAAGTVFARIQRSINGGSTWETMGEGIASHPGGTTDRSIEVPEATPSSPARYGMATDSFGPPCAGITRAGSV